MNGKLRFTPSVTTVIVLAWLVTLMGIYFVWQGKRELLLAGRDLLLASLSLLNVPDVFWTLCAGRLLDLTTTALLLASAWCVGLALLRLLRWVERIEPLTHLIAIATGLGVWAWFVLIAGLLGHISPVSYVAPAILSLGLVCWHWPWIQKCRQETRHDPAKRWSGFEIFLVVCLGLGFVLNLIPAFTPEIEYDALEYHLGALREYQKAGRICFLPHNFYANMPSLTEMLYLWGITLRSSSVAKLIHSSFAVLTALGLISFGKKLHSRQLGLTAAALFYLLPFVTNLGETARIDLATTFFAFLAGAALYQHLFDERKKFLWLAGLMAGLTLATKYTAAPLVLLPIMSVLMIYWKQSAISNRQSAILFLALALIPVVPWLIKNAIFTGNPFYPIANGLFHNSYWGEEQTVLFHSRHGPKFDTGRAWASFFTSLWTYSTRESFSSPILLLFAPLFLLLAKSEPRWKFCAWYGCLIYVCWFTFTFRPWRFVFPALPWFALLGAAAIATLERERALGLLLRVTLGVMLVFNLNYSFLASAVDISNANKFPPEMNKLGIFFGRISAADYLGNIYFTQGWMSGHLPSNANVLYVGEARTYYATYHVLANTVYDMSIIGEMVAQSHTPEELLKQMKERGVTHIYINKDELQRLRGNYGYLKDMDWNLFNAFLNAHAKVIFQNNAHSVYEIQG